MALFVYVRALEFVIQITVPAVTTAPEELTIVVPIAVIPVVPVTVKLLPVG